MTRINLQSPVSAGILLSYKCTSRCRHCMYACSPDWSGDWVSEVEVTKYLSQLAPGIAPSPLGPRCIGVNHGIHFTGGEPFQDFPLLLQSVRAARELSIPSIFVETNCFWCTSDAETKDRLKELREHGMDGILISVNPFVLEYVPFQRTERAVRISADIFGRNALVYQQVFYTQFRALGVKDTLSFDDYLDTVSVQGLRFAELLPTGRLTGELAGLYRRYPAREFFSNSCAEELTRSSHIHVDNYGNYVPGFCAGISLGYAGSLSQLCGTSGSVGGRIIDALARDLSVLWGIGKDFGYTELKQGYISKCHLCLDIRKLLAASTEEFPELSPGEFYLRL